jgi:hypothetical protein
MKAIIKLFGMGNLLRMGKAVSSCYFRQLKCFLFIDINSIFSCTAQAYLPIIAYGPNAAVLHYGRNNSPIPSNPDSFLLVDAGNCYSVCQCE